MSVAQGCLNTTDGEADSTHNGIECPLCVDICMHHVYGHVHGHVYGHVYRHVRRQNGEAESAHHGGECGAVCNEITGHRHAYWACVCTCGSNSCIDMGTGGMCTDMQEVVCMEKCADICTDMCADMN